MTWPRRAWRAPLWVHAAALGVLLLLLLPAMSPHSAFTSDEGAYALQVRSLEKGSWAYHYRAADLDPGGRHFPIVLSTRQGDSFFTYIQHPAYPLLLRAGTAVAGTILGLHLLPLLGVVAAAVAAWLLAAQIDPGLSRPAFWVTAASPLVVNGYLLWAHAPSAGVAGLTLVAAVAVARRGLRCWATVGLLAGVVAGVLLRSEGLLFALALAGGLAVARRRAAGLAGAAASLAAVAGTSLAAVLTERAWVSAIAGGAYDNVRLRGESSSYLAGRLAGALHELVGADAYASSAGLLALAAVGVAGGLGYLALRRWGPGSTRDLTLGFGLAAFLYLLRYAAYPDEPITGLLAAWPVAVIGLALFPWRRKDAASAVPAVTLGLFVLAVLATQYPEGGGFEWGGRFFSPVIVPVAVLAVAGLVPRLRAAPTLLRRRATGAIVGLAAVTTVVALATVGSMRAEHDRIVEAVAARSSPVMVTTVGAIPRLAWRNDDRLSWMVADEESLPGLLQSIRDKGITEVAVLIRQGSEPLPTSGYAEVREVAGPTLQDNGMSLLLFTA